ncbi:MAG: MFS transporter, partial [Mycobacterium sp.]
MSGRRRDHPDSGPSPAPGRRSHSGPAAEHPGMANYPADDPDYRRSRRPPPMPSANRYLPPLDREPKAEPRRVPPRSDPEGERVTVTRAAAQRSREMGSRMYWLVQRAATADGADKSGLTALTWPVVANFATDAAMAVALANTLFFAAATGESKDRVALYLLITIAPFAVIAPLIGPALDRLQ